MIPDTGDTAEYQLFMNSILELLSIPSIRGAGNTLGCSCLHVNEDKTFGILYFKDLPSMLSNRMLFFWYYILDVLGDNQYFDN